MSRGRRRKETIEIEQPIERPIGEAPPPILPAIKSEPEEINNQIQFDDFDAPGLPQKDLFRVDEVAQYFDITERAVRLWVDNGILERRPPDGIVRITRRSIIRCLNNPRLKIREKT